MSYVSYADLTKHVMDNIMMVVILRVPTFLNGRKKENIEHNIISRYICISKSTALGSVCERGVIAKFG